MSLHRHTITGEVRDISEAWLDSLRTVGSPKADAWQPYTPPPVEPEAPQPYKVSKDTIITRCLEAGALPAVMAALSQQSAEQQFVFAQSAWFWSNNATLRGMCAALGLDAEVILAPDPHI